MLSLNERQLVKATIPLLKEQGLNLTRHFYQRLFLHYPELKNIFNQSHQHNNQQQQALAAAVLAYAEHIDAPGVLAPVLRLVANKHASLGVKAEHYPIVGEQLLASIREVLGEAIATDAILSAWGAAYQQLADLLIAAEAELYQQAAVNHAGWNDWRAFQIRDKVVESEEITSFYLVPLDEPLPLEFKPGQYVSVRIEVPALGLLQPRQYSLSDAPGKDYLRISVKREPAVVGSVSNLLHQHYQIGDRLELSPPMGDFYLHAERQTPVVLLSGGVGFTPLLAMLNQLLETASSRQIGFVHASRYGQVDGLRRLLPRTNPDLPVRPIVFYEQPLASDQPGRDFDYQGRVDWSKLSDLILPEADYYLCGPRPFMQQQRQHLLDQGISAERIHTEVFGSGGF